MLSESREEVVKLPTVAVTCPHCSLYGVCSIPDLDPGRQNRLDQIIKRRQPLQRGDNLFEVREPFQSIYCVKSGSVKTYYTTVDGEELITGFHMPGELVGLEALSLGHSDATARALETSSFCEIPITQLQELAEEIPALQRRLLDMMSLEIAHLQTLTVLLNRKSAEERIATFLLSLSSRLGHRGFSPKEFHLRMTRNDIGSYLGLAVETVSRVFTRFNDAGLISVRRRNITLNDIERLRHMAGNPTYRIQAAS